jgi:predicted enzyme related to lactoylglutathione lyase
MRHLILAMTAALNLVIAQSQADSSKSWPADVGPGRVAWFDLTTTDLAKSKQFYSKLFEWTFRPVQGTDMAVEIVSRDAAIGTLRVAEGPISAFNGVIYVQVKDIQAACNKAKELGATVAPGFPFNLANGTGAIGLILDPAGHPLGLYSRTPMAAAKPPAQ